MNAAYCARATCQHLQANHLGGRCLVCATAGRSEEQIVHDFAPVLEVVTDDPPVDPPLVDMLPPNGASLRDGAGIAAALENTNGLAPSRYAIDGVGYPCGCEFRTMDIYRAGGSNSMDLRWRKCDAHRGEA